MACSHHRTGSSTQMATTTTTVLTAAEIEAFSNLDGIFTDDTDRRQTLTDHLAAADRLLAQLTSERGIAILTVRRAALKAALDSL